MIRRLFTAASAMSLVLCISISVRWANSYSESDDIGWQKPVATHGYDRWGIKTLDGLGALHHTVDVFFPYVERNHLPEPQHAGFICDGLELQGPHQPLAAHSLAGFGWQTNTYAGFSEREVLFPLWLPAVLTLILPCLWFGRNFRSSQEQRRPQHSQK